VLYMYFQGKILWSKAIGKLMCKTKAQFLSTQLKRWRSCWAIDRNVSYFFYI
jgi:hypothetical protein